MSTYSGVRSQDTHAALQNPAIAETMGHYLDRIETLENENTRLRNDVPKVKVTPPQGNKAENETADFFKKADQEAVVAQLQKEIERLKSTNISQQSSPHFHAYKSSIKTAHSFKDGIQMQSPPANMSYRSPFDDAQSKRGISGMSAYQDYGMI